MSAAALPTTTRKLPWALYVDHSVHSLFAKQLLLQDISGLFGVV